MGCRMLAVLDSDVEPAGERLAQVPGWFEVWEQRLSRFRSDSELCRVNDRSGAPVPLSPVLWDVCQAAIEAERLSGGLVQPTMLDALEAAGYDRGFESLAAAQASEPSGLWAPDYGGPTEIHLDRASRSLFAPAGVRLDLGGIAKGWAADRAARRLATCDPALVDAGGDVAVSGPLANGQGWPIGVADPHSNTGRLVDTIALRRGGVATSGRDYRRWRRLAPPHSGSACRPPGADRCRQRHRCCTVRPVGRKRSQNGVHPRKRARPLLAGSPHSSEGLVGPGRRPGRPQPPVETGGKGLTSEPTYPNRGRGTPIGHAAEDLPRAPFSRRDREPYRRLCSARLAPRAESFAL